jgi:hypothetical protein
MDLQWIFQYDPFIRPLRRTLRGMHSLPDSDTRYNIKNIMDTAGGDIEKNILVIHHTI